MEIIKNDSSDSSNFFNRELIGTGSNGNRVYKIYAMKKIIINKQEGETYLNEINIFRSLEHQNIIKYYDSFINKDKLYIIMEYAEKGDLNSVIKQKVFNTYENIDEEIIWKWFTQITSAIRYIHGKKILHRDIKVENIFISADDSLKIGDFGISKCLENSMDFAASGVGTPYYLSPEICQGLKYNFKSDIWMLGCLLYELCTLKKPFKSDSIKLLIKNIINNEPESIDTNIYSEGLTNLIKLMLNKVPEDRPDIEAVWLMSEFCSKSNIPASKLIDKNKLKIEVEDQENSILENNSPMILSNKLTPVSSGYKHYKNPIISNPNLENLKKYKIQQKLTPNNHRVEINKIRKNMNLSPMNIASNNTKNYKNTNRRASDGTTTNSTPRNVIIYKNSESSNRNNFNTGNTGKNFKNKHFRHISINISSMQSPQNNAVYHIDNIESVENIKFSSPINNLKSNKPILTPRNFVNIKQITPKEALSKKEVPLTTKNGKIQTRQYSNEEILNRRKLIKNFLIQRYSQEKFEIMYNCIMKNNSKIDKYKIKEIVGEDYKIAMNYLSYLTNNK